MRRRTALVALVMLGGTLGACSSKSDSGSSAAKSCSSGATVVKVVDNNFEPEDLEIDAGTEVCWKNEGRNEHNVKPNEGDAFGIASIKAGETYSYTFANAGDFAYYCTFHGAPNKGQHGTVKAAEAAAGSSTTASVGPSS
jgi:plastocyanin